MATPTHGIESDQADADSFNRVGQVSGNVESLATILKKHLNRLDQLAHPAASFRRRTFVQTFASNHDWNVSSGYVLHLARGL